MSSEISEVTLSKSVTESDYFNEDLAPTKMSERTWGTGNIAALWVGMAVCVPTYTLGGVLTTYFGLSVMEALFTILLANIVVLIPLTLNAFPGTKFGIPFPVVLRSSFGIVGSNIPCLIRGFVACGWFGIQTMFGGLAIHLFFSAISDGWASLGGVGEVIGFFIFWALNMYVVIRGAESIKWLETLSAPLLLIVGIAIAYDTFFTEQTLEEIVKISNKDLNFFSLFILEFSEDMPFFYGLFSIMFAIFLGVGAAFIRRFFSNLRKKILLKS